MKTAPSNWLGYTESLRDKRYEPEELIVEGLDPLIRFSRHKIAHFTKYLPVFYMLDYTTGHYMSMSDTVKELLGFTTRDFMAEGMSLLAENLLENDLKILNEKMFPSRLALLRDTPQLEHKDYVFTHNFQMRNASKRMTHLLQQSCFVKSGQDGRPLIGLGIVINIGHYSQSSGVTQLIEKICPDSPEQQPQTISQTTYFAREEDHLLTRREKEVLLWMAEGLSTKQIADKLFVSEHTVVNHRRHMIQKTNTSNAPALISFAIKNGII